ncbi:MAG TPA: biotin/lipoyl-binding protein, partial [Phenylobacterium sp.]|uniref:biotin/lipoyl-binding protein n=1 Tax=Phenylobacterium sp. TaxID=1871053 RepID=UPI002C449461
MSRRIVLLAVMGALALAGCRKPPPPRTTAADQARSVSVARVEPRAITGALAASGDLMPREEAAVLPEVAGYRVAKVLVDVGDYVKKGQTLVELDPALIQAQLAQAEANVAQAQAQAAQAAEQAARVK